MGEGEGVQVPGDAMVVVVVEEISQQVFWFGIFVLIVGMPEDLRRPFGHFGPLKDIYLPRDYYSGEPRGFGFVQFVDPADAAEAKYQMDGQVFQGRELTVVFAEENRKKPTDMRMRERRGGGRYNDRRRSPPRRYSRSPRRYSRSPPPRHGRSRSRSHDYSPAPKRKHHSRSVSPRGKRYSRERSYSPSPARQGSPPYNGGSRSRSQSPVKDRSPPPYNGSRSPSPGPERARLPPTSRSPSRSRSRSRSPDPRDYPRGKPDRDGSVSP
uniref:Putative SC35-like splicing factor 30A n=1 Tax=Helianthus annuus TaxID=4232 RepID=A0A251VRH3_HELAN